MKKKFFSCFHPLVLETEAETEINQINADSTISESFIIPKDQISVQRNNSKGPFSKVLEILLHKASLKIKVSDRNCRQLLFQPKNAALRRISKHLQKSSDNKTTRDKGLSISRTQIRGRSSYESNNTTSSTAVLSPSVDRQESGEGSSEFRKSCSRRINPGLYLLLFILFFTVVLGRIRAVLFALLFLYLFPGFLR